MKRLLLPLGLSLLLSVPLLGQTADKPAKKTTLETNRVTAPADRPDRVERAKTKYEELFGQPITASKTDPELMTILQRFIFGEVFFVGNLDDKMRELITITALTANQTLPQLTAHTNAALNVGVTPIEIREVVISAPHLSAFPKCLTL